MPQSGSATRLEPSALTAAIERATQAVPPLWPLASSVAVNPFLGQGGETLASAGARLARVAGVPVTMPRHWYRNRIDSGAITDEDLHAAWLRTPTQLRPVDLDALRTAIATDRAGPAALPTLADLAAQMSGIDWPGIIADRFGAWASGHFDAGQALWTAPREENAYASWRAFATHDLTPEIAGLPGFPRHVTKTPGNPAAAIAGAVGRLRIPEPALETCFHQLLLSLGGWSQYARYRHWQAGLAGTTDPTIVDLLAIRLVWEEALFVMYEPSVTEAWSTTLAAHSAPVSATRDLVVDSILQDAAEHAAQRSLAATLARESNSTAGERPLLQAVFCIDVRSEVFRRALESLDPRISTLGFAGFFGIATAHRRFASDAEERRLPVLLQPGLSSRASAPEPDATESDARVTARAKRAWGRFKLAAVSSFAFVEAAGVLHAGSLLVDALGLRRAPTSDDPAPRLDPGLDLAARVRMAETVLRAMSLTSGFARLVLLAGHGASVVNNPHASGLNCGACGGYSADVNARLLAGLLNDEEVRAALIPRGIGIPADTLFVAALHDTSTDDIRLYDADHPAVGHAGDLAQAKAWLAAAGALARGERALRLPRAGQGAALQ